MTHVKRKDSSLNEVGEVMWHSLDKNGNISIYDVHWPSVGLTEHNIPAKLLEGVDEHEHGADEVHGVQSESTPIHHPRREAFRSIQCYKLLKITF